MEYTQLISIKHLKNSKRELKVKIPQSNAYTSKFKEMKEVMQSELREKWDNYSKKEILAF